MHPRVIGERMHQANGRILAAAAQLAEQHDLPPLAINPARRRDQKNDNVVQRLHETEAVATFLEALASKGQPQPAADDGPTGEAA